MLFPSFSVWTPFSSYHGPPGSIWHCRLLPCLAFFPLWQERLSFLLIFLRSVHFMFAPHSPVSPHHIDSLLGILPSPRQQPWLYWRLPSLHFQTRPTAGLQTFRGCLLLGASAQVSYRSAGSPCPRGSPAGGGQHYGKCAAVPAKFTPCALKSGPTVFGNEWP